MARDLVRDWMWSEACEMLARAERMHREVFRPAGLQARQPAWEPPVDILETESEVLVLVALPGVDVDNAQAVIEDGDLVIAGNRVLPEELRTATIHRLELPQGRFYRRLRLPAGRYSGVRRFAASGCLVVTLQKAGVELWLKKYQAKASAQSAPRLAGIAVGRADHRAGAQHSAVSGASAADHAGPAEVDRCRAAGGAGTASGRHPVCSATAKLPIRPRSTCIAWARSPTSCATSPRPMARITWSARASNVFRSSNI